ncbi:cobalamin B12-binding domain-containing protein [Seohaeicola saemankumensis]|uniref:cobalamin B12-binding domain-containing protein n=1 Tax=Seohaeicola TaxID=481178 RepID=UPI0035CF8C1D
MQDETASLDENTFERTATIFRQKRQILAPEAFQSLALIVVRKLAGLAAQLPRPEVSSVSPDKLACLCDLLVQQQSKAALRFIEERRAEGATRDALFYGYIAGAAQMLGRRWDGSEASFLDVAVGTGHLYALMRAVKSDRTQGSRKDYSSKAALFATVPGELHSIGIMVATDTFREAGWDIDLQLGRDQAALVDHIERTHPEIIGLSFSTTARLVDMISLIVELRIVQPHALIGVAPPTEFSEDDLLKVADVDLVFDDAKSALKALERLTSLRN